MTDRDAMLAAILSDPADDLPRLMYADWLDENGDSEQAEFIRMQVELARNCDPECGVGRICRTTDGVLCSQRRKHERELLKQCWTTYFRGLFPYPLGIEIGTVTMLWTKGISFRQIEATPVRGFVASVRLSWKDWLHHHEALYWHPKQTVECPACNGRGGYDEYRGIGEWDWASCPPCESTGRIHRPFVATAQPITEVELTTWMPRVENIVRRDHGEADSFFTLLDNDERLTFTRVKCNGEPLNEWTCDRWPTITFKMP